MNTIPNINLKDLQSEKPQIKYRCAKQAIALSEKNPKALYPRLDTFIRLLEGENNVLKWTALIVIGNLSAADTKGRITRLLPQLIKFTKDPSLITASNAVQALGKIAQHDHKIRSKIFKALLGVEKVIYYNKGQPSPECRNIVIGHSLDVLAGFDKKTLKASALIMAFIRRQIKNSRPSVRKRAEKLLKHIETTK